MKILLTVTLAMLVSTTVFAECKEGEACSKEECAKLGKDFALNEGKKCVKVADSQTETQCPGIVGTSGAKQVGSEAGKPSQTSGTNVTK